MKHIILNFFLIIFTTVLITACGSSNDEKPKDTEKPVIVDPSTPSTDVDNPTKFTQSGMVKYTGTFTDNEALKQVTFSLSSLKTANGTDDPAWAPAAVNLPLEDKEAMVDQQIFEDIPTNIYTGDYLLNIVCTDVAGNTSNTKSIKVIIE